MDSLRAEIEARPSGPSRSEDLSIEGAIVNDGPTTVTLNVAPLASPSLCLEIVDAQGGRVLLPPPPIPKEQRATVDLGPGDQHRVNFRGFVPSWIPPGSYRVRLRYLYTPPGRVVDIWTGELLSGWTLFEIR